MRNLGLFLGMRRRRAISTTPPPINTVPPVVSGVGYVGYTLSTTNGTWTGSPTFTYQWQRFTGGVWTDIAGATASTYAVQISDEGVPVRCVVTGTNGGGSASASSNAIEQWVPSDGGTVRTRYDAANLSTLIFGVGVSQWNDLGTAGDNLEQLVAATQPTYNATGFGGRPCLNFNTAQYLRRTVSLDILRNVTGATLGCAFRLQTSGGARIWYGVSTPSVLNQRFRVGCSGTSHNIGGRRLDSDNFASTNLGGVSVGTRSSAVSIHNYGTAQASAEVNGLAAGPNTLLTAGATSDTVSAVRSLGANIAGTEGFFGDICEIVLYETALSTAQRQRLAGYLHWRWHMVDTLNASHPYKTVPPTP